VKDLYNGQQERALAAVAAICNDLRKLAAYSAVSRGVVNDYLRDAERAAASRE